MPPFLMAHQLPLAPVGAIGTAMRYLQTCVQVHARRRAKGHIPAPVGQEQMFRKSC